MPPSQMPATPGAGRELPDVTCCQTSPMLRMTGFLLDDLHAVRDLLQNTRYGALRAKVAELHDAEDRGFNEAARLTYDAIPLAYVVVGTVRTALSISSYYTADTAATVEDACRKAGTVDESVMLPRLLANFGVAIGFVLDLRPEPVRALWEDEPPTCDRGEVEEVLDGIKSALDRLEREVSGRGGWPR